MDSGITFPCFHDLLEYLLLTGSLSILQFLLFAYIVHRVASRAVRACLARRRMEALLPGENIADELTDKLAQVCAAMGLVLTFAGLYGDVAAGGAGDLAAVRLALGSSALGYSSLIVYGLAAVLDELLDNSRRSPCRLGPSPAGSRERLTQGGCP